MRSLSRRARKHTRYSMPPQVNPSHSHWPGCECNSVMVPSRAFKHPTLLFRRGSLTTQYPPGYAFLSFALRQVLASVAAPPATPTHYFLSCPFSFSGHAGPYRLSGMLCPILPSLIWLQGAPCAKHEPGGPAARCGAGKTRKVRDIPRRQCFQHEAR